MSLALRAVMVVVVVVVVVVVARGQEVSRRHRLGQYLPHDPSRLLRRRHGLRRMHLVAHLVAHRSRRG